jgi:hypothetical protein
MAAFQRVAGAQQAVTAARRGLLPTEQRAGAWGLGLKLARRACAAELCVQQPGIVRRPLREAPDEGGAAALLAQHQAGQVRAALLSLGQALWPSSVAGVICEVENT